MDLARPTWQSHVWPVAAGTVLLLVLPLVLVGVDGPAAAWTVTLAAVTVAAGALGWAVRRTRALRRRYEDDLTGWAADRAAQAERLRIAADLHDLVSHGLGLITVRAAVASTVDGPQGDQVRAAALADVERVSRETTTELRRMLGVLRGSGTAPLRPADTIADLPAIVRSANAAGLRVTLDVREVGAVSAGVQLAVCAVVREALSNTLRHAGPTRGHVAVHRDGCDVVVDAHDAGPDPSWRSQPGAGHGLDALRERVAALGGTLRAEHVGPGFHLTARVPETGRA